MHTEGGKTIDGTVSKTYPTFTLFITKPEENPGLRSKKPECLAFPSKDIRLVP